MPTDRPKASYLDWFKELIANYKLIAMLIVALGGYSGLNLWKDVERYRAESSQLDPSNAQGIQKAFANARAENRSTYSLLEHTHPEKAFEKALNAHIARDHIKDHKELHQ